jgi:L,D-peptidoglycan transpeptidase YkuD (ErfK/YbiS/YcfS/YnhG family)
VPLSPASQPTRASNLASLVLALAATVAAPCLSRATSSDACRDRGLSVLVDTQLHRLWLCEDGALVNEFAVALGRGGTGKREEGDRKTPLGSYPLGTPRESARFHTFIPIGYPTEEQRQQGLTGSNLGIHGPDRKPRWLDWTLGCVAVGSDAAIDEIAAWVRLKQPAMIELL